MKIKDIITENWNLDENQPTADWAEGIKKLLAIGVKLQDIPSFTKDGTNMSKVVDTGDRIMVVININGTNMPYYISTGEGGKASVPTGKWYPFFGSGPSGWLNKGSEQSINKFYGSSVLKTYANLLNLRLGNLQGQSLPPMKKAGRDVINKDMLNPQSHFTTPEEAEVFKKRINAILKSIGSDSFYQVQSSGDVKEAKDGIGSVQSVFGDVNDMKAMTQLSVEQLNKALSMGLGKGTIVARKFSKHYGSAFIYDVKLSDGEWASMTIIINPRGRVYGWLGSTIFENFHDGKKPGRKGLAKRVGVNCKQPVSKLRSIAKNSSGEKQRMAHWCANMKSGKK